MRGGCGRAPLTRGRARVPALLAAFDAGGASSLLVAVLMLSVSAPLHLHLLNSTLASGSVSVAVPLYQCLLISVSTGAGGLIFGEFAQVGPHPPRPPLAAGTWRANCRAAA